MRRRAKVLLESLKTQLEALESRMREERADLPNIKEPEKLHPIEDEHDPRRIRLTAKIEVLEHLLERA